ALLYGRQLARAHGATLHLLHIVGNVASEMASPIGIGPNSGQMQMELYADAEQIDLIIVGTHGRNGFAHFFMGSVAQHVVRRASCPVLTVRHPEREFVVPEV